MKRLLTTTAMVLVAGLTASAHAQSDNSGTAGGCAASWMNVDSNGNGTISKDEVQAATDADFSRIDADGDGHITVTEWKDCGDRSAFPGTSAALDRFPGQSGTGEMTQESPASDQAQADLKIDEPATTGSISASGGKNWQQNFSAADTDKSGYLSPDEAANASSTDYDLSSSQFGATSDEENARVGSSVFATLDADGNGQLSQEEWSSRDNANVQTNLEARYGRIDSNGDGQVTKEEFSAFRDKQASAAEQTAMQVNGGDSGGTGEEGIPVTVYYYYVW